MPRELTPDVADLGTFELGSIFWADLNDSGTLLHGPMLRPDPDDVGTFEQAQWEVHTAARVPSREEALTGNRSTRFRYEVLDRYGNVLGDLTGAQDGGSLTWTANQAVKGRGSISYIEDGQAVDWLNARIRITRIIEDADGLGEAIETPLGVWVPSAPTWTHSATYSGASISLLSREVILSRQGFPTTFSLPAGTNIVQAVRDIITGAGEQAGALTDSDKVLAADRVWPAGTTRLQVINDLATAGGFMSLYSDALGQYRLVPDVRASSRPISWRFEGAQAVYVPEFSREQDVYSIPNTFMATARGEDEDDPLVSVARNDDPDSPYSTVNRGEVWAPVESIDAADQGTLEAFAVRRLAELTSASAFVDIDILPLPLWFNEAVWFTSPEHSLDARYVITQSTVALSATGLMRLRLREVILD